MNIAYSDLKFLEKTKKAKKTYDKEQNLTASEFDIKECQANLKTINKVNKEKGTNHQYKWYAHRRKLYSNLPNLKAIEIEGLVDRINSSENPSWRVDYCDKGEKTIV